MIGRRGFLGRVLLAAVGTLAIVYVPGRPWEVGAVEFKWVMVGPLLDSLVLYEDFTPILKKVPVRYVEWDCNLT